MIEYRKNYGMFVKLVNNTSSCKYNLYETMVGFEEWEEAYKRELSWFPEKPIFKYNLENIKETLQYLFDACCKHIPNFVEQSMLEIMKKNDLCRFYSEFYSSRYEMEEQVIYDIFKTDYDTRKHVLCSFEEKHTQRFVDYERGFILPDFLLNREDYYNRGLLDNVRIVDAMLVEIIKQKEAEGESENTPVDKSDQRGDDIPESS